MKILLTLLGLSSLILTSSISSAWKNENSFLLNSSRSINIKNFIASRDNLNDYGYFYVGSLNPIDLTAYLNIHKTGDLSKRYNAIYFPDLLATANKFSYQVKKNTFSFHTDVIPDDNLDWKSSRTSIINVSEDWGSAHIEGAVAIQLSFYKTNINHVMLNCNFYMHGVSWATQNDSYEYLDTGNRIEFVYR